MVDNRAVRQGVDFLPSMKVLYSLGPQGSSFRFSSSLPNAFLLNSVLGSKKKKLLKCECSL